MKHYLGICLVLVTICALALLGFYSCSVFADRTVSHVQDAFAQVFQLRPQVTVNQRVVLTQTAPIAELAIVSKEELVTLGFDQHLELLSYEIPLTEKTLSVQAVFRLKAGFDLRQPFLVKVDPTTHQVEATLPHAKILSVEQLGDLTFHGDDSALNRITDPEREKLLNDLNATAHAQADSSTLKSEAEQQVVSRLEQIFAHNGEKLSTQWSSVDPSSAPKP